MTKEPRAYRRSVRKKQIIKILRDWKQMDYATEATSYQLADALDLRPTQRLRDLLNEMVAEGLLQVVERDQSGRWTTKFYLLHETASYHGETRVRQIPLKSRGVAVGQLEMFS